MQRTRELQDRAIVTFLPEKFIRRAEKLYKKIHDDTGFGSIELDIAQDEISKSKYSVTEQSEK
jgi:hypothetical protein